MSFPFIWKHQTRATSHAGGVSDNGCYRKLGRCPSAVDGLGGKLRHNSTPASRVRRATIAAREQAGAPAVPAAWGDRAPRIPAASRAPTSPGAMPRHRTMAAFVGRAPVTNYLISGLTQSRILFRTPLCSNRQASRTLLRLGRQTLPTAATAQVRILESHPYQ
jgi:hypothetical protein